MEERELKRWMSWGDQQHHSDNTFCIGAVSSHTAYAEETTFGMFFRILYWPLQGDKMQMLSCLLKDESLQGKQ